MLGNLRNILTLPARSSRKKLCKLRFMCKTPAMADDKELKDQRVPIMMTPSELEAIDDWMFKNRIRSRGEAIRRLCQMGILSDEGSEKILGAITEHHKSIMRAIDGFTEVLNTNRESMERDLVELFGDSLLEFAEESSELGRLISSVFVPAAQMGLHADMEDALRALRDAKAAASLVVGKPGDE